MSTTLRETGTTLGNDYYFWFNEFQHVERMMRAQQVDFQATHQRRYRQEFDRTMIPGWSPREIAISFSFGGSVFCIEDFVEPDLQGPKELVQHCLDEFNRTSKQMIDTSGCVGSPAERHSAKLPKYAKQFNVDKPWKRR